MDVKNTFRRIFSKCGNRKPPKRQIGSKSNPRKAGSGGTENPSLHPKVDGGFRKKNKEGQKTTQKDPEPTGSEKRRESRGRYSTS